MAFMNSLTKFTSSIPTYPDPQPITNLVEVSPVILDKPKVEPEKEKEGLPTSSGGKKLLFSYKRKTNPSSSVDSFLQLFSKENKVNIIGQDSLGPILDLTSLPKLEFYGETFIMIGDRISASDYIEDNPDLLNLDECGKVRIDLFSSLDITDPPIKILNFNPETVENLLDTSDFSSAEIFVDDDKLFLELGGTR